jgi:hypothetical protein
MMSTSRLSALPSPSAEAGPLITLLESVGSPTVADNSGPVAAAAEQVCVMLLLLCLCLLTSVYFL